VTRPPLPEGFLRRTREQLGAEDAADLIGALGAAPAAGLRANPRHGSPWTLTERLGWRAAAVPWCAEGVVLTEPRGASVEAGRHPWHEGGAYYLQDPSAMGVVPLLDPQPGEAILDLAAAPGGKATHIAGRLGDRGLLWAHDATPTRADALVSNLERWGATTAVVSQGDPRKLRALAGRFDRVLVDAPCSGEGMFRKSDAARLRWSLERVRACSLIQATLLDLAADLVRPGGVLVYATCTFAPEEDEAAVEALLARRPDLELVDLDARGLRPAGTATGAGAVAAGCVRWWPHRVVGDGHFAARFRRGDPVPAEPRPDGPNRGPAAPSRQAAARSRRAVARGPRAVGRPTAPHGPERDAWRSFVAEVLGAEPLPGHALLADDGRLLAVPADALEMDAPWRRAGVALGRVVGGRRGQHRFEPHHALSRVLPVNGAAAARVDLEPDDPRVAAFLHGETLALDGPDGWGLVRAGGVPLGWVKVKRGEANNHYPKGLRRELARDPAEPHADDG
jgi:NOL1/NOP2/sun family putative RNA methylase